jgi:hypothetical protein
MFEEEIVIEKDVQTQNYADAVRFSASTNFRVANRFKLAEKILSQTE